MNKGAVVMVFSDPITENNFEGTAVLIKRMHDLDNGGPCETWMVKFNGENRKVMRKIKKVNKRKDKNANIRKD